MFKKFYQRRRTKLLRQYYYIRVQTALYGWKWIIRNRSQKPGMVKYRAFIHKWNKKHGSLWLSKMTTESIREITR